MRIAAVLFASTLLMAQAPTHSTTPAPKGASTSTAGRPTSARPAAAKPAQSAKTENSVLLNTEDEKTIYALGLSIYQSVRQFDLSPKELEIIRQALADAEAGKPAADIKVYGPKIQALAEARGAQLAQKQKEVSKVYLDKAATEPGAVRTQSGLIYKQLSQGSGASPQASDSVKVNYRGTFVDGKEFDSSNGTPIEFALNGVIPCWTEGLQHMKVGEKAQLVCPSEIAYGERGNRGIPGGSTLVFEVELLEIKQAAPPQPGTPAAPPIPPNQQ